MNEGEILKQLISEDYGISGNGRWYRSDEHSSLVLDFEKGIFYFNSRSVGGGVLEYLMSVRKYSFADAKEYIKARGYTDTVTITFHPKGDVITYPKLASAFWENTLEQKEITREYWYYRKLTDTTIDRFQLGYFNGWYTIPIFFEDSLRQIQLRKDHPKKEIKKWYKNVTALLYNSDVLKFVDKVFIVEGPNDVLALAQQNIPAVCSDSGAEYWSDDWYYKFVRCKEIYVCLDADSAGDNGSKKIAKHLGEYRTKIYNFWGFDKGYSPSYFFRDGGTKDEFLEIVNRNSRYVFEIKGKSNENFH